MAQTASSYRDRFEFLCEKRLYETDSDLHRLFSGSTYAIDLFLAKYKRIFPFYTDHSMEHSEQVIRYCNIIAGEEIVSALNPDELYILLMGASLHDIGMGISKSDFPELVGEIPALQTFIEEHPGLELGEYTRRFHQDLSAQFIIKYRHVFDIPSDEHVFCIAQVAKGHRKSDLMNEEEYPAAYVVPSGRTVNLAYLAALVKLADELDVTADRNLLFDYRAGDTDGTPEQKMCYACHEAIKKLDVCRDELVLYYDTDDPAVDEEIRRMSVKVEKTFGEYCEVVEKRTPFHNRIRTVRFLKTEE